MHFYSEQLQCDGKPIQQTDKTVLAPNAQRT